MKKAASNVAVAVNARIVNVGNSGIEDEGVMIGELVGEGEGVEVCVGDMEGVGDGEGVSIGMEPLRFGIASGFSDVRKGTKFTVPNVKSSLKS